MAWAALDPLVGCLEHAITDVVNSICRAREMGLKDECGLR